MLAHDIVYGYRKAVCYDIESLNAERNLTGTRAHENVRTNAFNLPTSTSQTDTKHFII